MRSEGHGASLAHELEPLKLATDATISLGVVVTEWVANAFKYAYPGRSGEVFVRLKQLSDGRGELTVEDTGAGRDEGASAKGTGLGTRIVKAMGMSMAAEVAYLRREPGTIARLTFSLKGD